MEKTVFYKIWRLFRLTFTVYLSLYYFSASAQVARLSLNMQQVPLQQVMDEIKKQTKYLFINQDVDTDRKVSINVENQIISEVLNQLFTPINVGYRIEQINIYVYNKSSVPDKPRTVTGKITATDGSSIPGATIIVKGTTLGTSTNADGTFSLQIPSPATTAQLEINYLGYEPMVVAVGSRTFFAITLRESAAEIDEVVVTALGIKRQEKALSYNVQQVKADAITDVKDANFMNSLAGKVAGLTINTGFQSTPFFVIKIDGNNFFVFYIST